MITTREPGERPSSDRRVFRIVPFMRLAIFDLDGTISDPSEGITAGINHSLSMMGLPCMDPRKLLVFIGPPLPDIFQELAPGRREEGTALFREYYRERGFSRNVLYPGIRDALETLRSSGTILCIATGKKPETAVDILEMFRMKELFHEITGCGHGGTKEELVSGLLARYGGNAVMIGDRKFDFEAASHCGIPSAGAAWGFGTRRELELATVVVENPGDVPGAVDLLLEGI